MEKKDKKKLAQFEIRFDKGAWEREQQRGNIKGRRTYTQRVAKSQKDVEPLNRYDDFAELKINPDVYEKTSGMSYGIPRDDAIHIYGGRHVVLDHQIAAAQKFLSELRGFGLLADVVGSGKTFEAGIVLSELAARNRIKTMLIVVPGQVFDTWVEVLENYFGLGKGTLYQVRAPKNDSDPVPSYNDILKDKNLGYTKQSTKLGEAIRPNKPILVDVRVFSQWTITDNSVYDVIVVDEAHHLCKEDGEYAKAMQLLSQLMVNKKKFGAATYCLLLSATPHSGNLENMFRLWYFIRCQGGNPSDFEAKEDQKRTDDYLKEKSYYQVHMCEGATNVTDFIRRVKLREIRDRYRKQLDQWIDSDATRRGTHFDQLASEYAKSSLVEDFLNDPANEKIKDEVLESAAHAYHALLRSIMIRQPNRLAATRKKFIQNILFYPVPQTLYPKLEKLQLSQGLAKDKITLDYSKAAADECFMPTVVSGGEQMTLPKYIEFHRGNESEKGAYALLMNKVLAELDSLYTKQFGADYTRKDYINFYTGRLRGVDADAWKQTTILPITADANYKYVYLTQLLRKHHDKRVIVFFDYELSNGESVIDSVVTSLQSEPNFSKRLILSDQANEEEIIKRFNAKQDAVLLVKSSALTEGANLQQCNIVINYQVTPDPLAMDQRIGRVFRLGQKNDVTIYSLADINQLEGFALAYFISIGLMSSNSGDATILAGSNSDQMVTIRCELCGNVKLKSRMEYEELLRNKSPELICHHYHTDYASEKPCDMKEISVSDYKCDKCGSVLKRPVGDEGYECLSFNREGKRGKMCNDGVCGDRTIYCWKPCAMSHCKRLQEIDCLALRRYREGQPESMLSIACRDCNKCQGYYEKCRIDHDVSGCRNCHEAGCDPAPYILHFNDKWEADCPNCRGKLRPVLPKTFAAYIRGLWKFPITHGVLNTKIDSFCENLGKEAQKVEQVKQVLKRDDEV